MLYLTLDTCVWLELLKVDFHTESNVFEEICYWIETNSLTHIAPENIIREWNRNKIKKFSEITGQIKSINKNLLNPFKGNSIFNSLYEPDKIEEMVTKRMARVDTILNTYSEIACENEKVFQEAIKRNFKCLAPNHSQDSFRDTINILTLLDHIMQKEYQDCFFLTKNFNDFSESKLQKHDLHPHLKEDFKNANLHYVFFDEAPAGSKLLYFLRPKLPNFESYLKEKVKKKEEEMLVNLKSVPSKTIENPDVDFLENVKYIDMILIKKNPTPFEQDMIQALIDRHESYKSYFMKNVGNNGMV
jgi:hypothetical protein